MLFNNPQIYPFFFKWEYHEETIYSLIHHVEDFIVWAYVIFSHELYYNFISLKNITSKKNILLKYYINDIVQEAKSYFDNDSKQ